LINYYVSSEDKKLEEANELANRRILEFSSGRYQSGYESTSENPRLSKVHSELLKSGITFNHRFSKDEDKFIITVRATEHSSIAEGKLAEAVLKDPVTDVEYVLKYDKERFYVKPHYTENEYGKKAYFYINGTPPNMLFSMEDLKDSQGNPISLRVLPKFNIQVNNNTMTVYYNTFYNWDALVDAVHQNAINQLREESEDYERYVPDLETIRSVYDEVSWGSMSSGSAAAKLAESFMGSSGIPRPTDVRAKFNLIKKPRALSQKIISDIQNDPDAFAVEGKVYVDRFVKGMIVDVFRGRREWFSRYFLDSEKVNAALERYRKNVSEKGDDKWFMPLEKNGLIFEAYVKACSEATLDDALTVFQETSGITISSEASSGNLEKLAQEIEQNTSLEAIAKQRLSNFRDALSKSINSVKLVDEVYRYAQEVFPQYVRDFSTIRKNSEAEEGDIPFGYISAFYIELTEPIWREDFYGRFDSESSKLPVKDINNAVATLMDVDPRVIEASNVYYDNAIRVSEEAGLEIYQRWQGKNQEQEQSSVKTTSYVDKGYGAVDENSDPMKALEEKENQENMVGGYKLVTEANGEKHLLVGGKRVKATEELLQTLENDAMPPAELPGLLETTVTEVPEKTKGKDIAKKSAKAKGRHQGGPAA